MKMPDKNIERKTLLVIILTLITMVVEILVGYFTHSMALFADGWHMGTHAFALSITFFIYILIRKLANSDKFAFGTGKFGTLSGFASSILLGLTGVWIIFESIERLFNPMSIGFNEAITVAVVGLIVNVVCILIMGADNHNHSHNHCEGKHEDFNFKSAYLHILADAMTSVFAITALIAGKLWNWIFLDAVVGFAGGVVICIWAYNLIKSTSAILVDCENETLKIQITKTLGKDVSLDYLHVWFTSEDSVSVVVKLHTNNKQLTLQTVKDKICSLTKCDVVTVEMT